MTVAFTRAKLKFTRASVDVLRTALDKVNVGINYAIAPVQYVFKKASLDAPWVFAVGTTAFFMSAPLFVYPWVKEWLLNDERKKKEAERIRLCLQKGVDPYPTLQHKDFVYGNVVPTFQRTSDTYPTECSWEHRSIQRYREAKEQLIKELGAKGDEDVETLLKLRKQLRKDFDEYRTSLAPEPEGLRFKGRPETNVLRN